MVQEGKIRAHELKDKPKADLLKKLEEMKTELVSLRIAKATGAAPAKLMKIRTIKKSIARILTVITQNQREHIRRYYADKKFAPKDIRPKLTRALRRKLTPAQLSRKTLRQKKKEAHFPLRKYAVKSA